MNTSLQLYTVREHTSNDFAATVKRVAEIGYRYVELAGYGNLKTAAEVKRACDDAKIGISGAHVSIEAFEKDIDAVMSDHETLGNKHLIIPYLSEDRRNGLDKWKALADSLNLFAKTVSQHGFTLSYHNHDFEFQVYDGQVAMDVVWNGTEIDMVGAELDLYWIARAGLDPVEYLKKLGRRTRFVHLKDMDKTDPKKFAPVGTGRLDFKSILATCKELGVTAGVAEQDDCYGIDSYAVAKTCFENLRKLNA
jgi:sugar phosphate isomerase/epimerase